MGKALVRMGRVLKYAEAAVMICEQVIEIRPRVSCFENNTGDG